MSLAQSLHVTPRPIFSHKHHPPFCGSALAAAISSSIRPHAACRFDGAHPRGRKVTTVRQIPFQSVGRHLSLMSLASAKSQKAQLALCHIMRHMFAPIPAEVTLTCCPSVSGGAAGSLQLGNREHRCNQVTNQSVVNSSTRVRGQFRKCTSISFFTASGWLDGFILRLRA